MRKALCIGFLLGLACLVATETAVAQDAGQGTRPRNRQRGSMVDRLKDELGLTEAQVTKAKELETAYRTKAREAGRDREKRRAAYDEYMTAFKAELTPEQVKKYDAYRTQMQQRFRRGMAGSAAQRMDRALRRLTLNEAARQKIEALRKERDAKIEAAANAFKDAVLPQLTPEQQEAFKKVLENPTSGRPRRTGGRGGDRSGSGTGSGGGS